MTALPKKITPEAANHISLLHQLADILRVQSPFTERLKLALQFVAENLGSESAFLYSLSEDHYLEAFASFDPHAHDPYGARFRIGEGLVGLIAASRKSLLCENMSHHPNFFYCPGVAEQINLALLGVPLLSPRGIIGVLTIQNPSTRPFAKEQEDKLIAIGNFLAALPEFNRFPLLTIKNAASNEMHVLEGVGLSSGVSIGTALIHHPRTWKEKAFSTSPPEENKRLKKAIREMMRSIDKLVTPDLDQNTKDVLNAYRMIAADRGWVRKMHDFIHKGFTAEAAVQKVRRITRERYAQIGDQLLKNRLWDLEDLASRLLRHLSGQETVSEELPESTILVAHNLGPAELLDYDRRFLKGVVLEEGVYTAHVTIVARALNIPIVGRLPFLLTNVREGDKLIIDGEDGTVIVSPTEEALKTAHQKIEHTLKIQALTAKLRDKPCQTKEGVPIRLSLNASLPTEIHQLKDFQVEGIGMYRTEIPFMIHTHFPDLETQIELYQDVVDQANTIPITFRTLDIGGDKVIPYIWQGTDDNPALGWRGMRVSLDKPHILKTQVRALMHATHGRELRLLFPMISDISEYREARQLVEEEWARTAAQKEPLPSQILYGMMLEVPSVVTQLPFLLKEVDFLSIGTNDLFQFFYACDRGNPTISTRYDVLSSSFLTYLQDICRTCQKANVPLTVCGEMAGTPFEALALLALGYRSLSMSGHAAGRVKKAILNFPLKEAEAFMEQALKDTYAASLREPFRQFLKDHEIEI